MSYTKYSKTKSKPNRIKQWYMVTFYTTNSRYRYLSFDRTQVDALYKCLDRSRNLSKLKNVHKIEIVVTGVNESKPQVWEIPS